MIWICKNCETENIETDNQCCVCGSFRESLSRPEHEKVPEIIDFSVSRAEANIGDIITLSWNVKYATEVSIRGLGILPFKGTKKIKINHFTSGSCLFKLIARNTRYSTTETIVVKQKDLQNLKPKIKYFKCRLDASNGKEIKAIISWDVVNSNNIHIDCLGEMKAASGSQEIDIDRLLQGGNKIKLVASNQYGCSHATFRLSKLNLNHPVLYYFKVPKGNVSKGDTVKLSAPKNSAPIYIDGDKHADGDKRVDENKDTTWNKHLGIAMVYLAFLILSVISGIISQGVSDFFVITGIIFFIVRQIIQHSPEFIFIGCVLMLMHLGLPSPFSVEEGRGFIWFFLYLFPLFFPLLIELLKLYNSDDSKKT